LAFHSGRDPDHSPPSSAEVKEWVELYLQSPTAPPWRGAQGEHRGVVITFFGPFSHIKIYIKDDLNLLLN
jgi:hypothetical protein